MRRIYKIFAALSAVNIAAIHRIHSFALGFINGKQWDKAYIALGTKSAAMGNAIEDALNRASPEQQERNRQVIEEARRNIKLVSVQQMDDLPPSAADSIARNAQVIEEAKRNIPFDTMKDVDTVSPPLNTPSDRSYYNSNIIELHPQTQSTIESIEQGNGNNYLRENAVDRAMARPSNETTIQDMDQQRQAIGR